MILKNQEIGFLFVLCSELAREARYWYVSKMSTVEWMEKGFILNLGDSQALGLTRSEHEGGAIAGSLRAPLCKSLNSAVSNCNENISIQT